MVIRDETVCFISIDIGIGVDTLFFIPKHEIV